ncbi:MAG TPA: hypothetical protein VK507_05915 [Iamia sp.]|nr:hypothetical protein [Iamia sp.]
MNDLLLDVSNARLPDPQPRNQQAAATALAKLDPRALVTLAEHIASHGTDPTTLPAVVATNDRRKRYRVVEGNRRVLALKALETPSLVFGSLNKAQQKRLTKAAARFANDPIDEIPCVLFKNIKEALTWIVLRHSGQQGGAGLWGWGSEEKDRFNERHGLDRPAANAREIVDFLDEYGVLGQRDQAKQRRILSNVDRLFSTPDVRRRVGIDYIRGGGVVSSCDGTETARVVGAIVKQMLDGDLPVGRFYDATDRRAFAAALSGGDLPDEAAQLSKPTRLADLPRRVARKKSKTPKSGSASGDQTSDDGSSKSGDDGSSTKKPGKKGRAEPRTVLIPRSCQLNIDPPRPNAIYLELQDLSVENTPNACGVLFRVFVELSIDHYIAAERIMTDAKMNKSQLGQKMREAAAHMYVAGVISDAVRKVVDTVANGRGPVNASAFNMNQYVHNLHINPSARELRDAWDEVQPFMEKLWP